MKKITSREQLTAAVAELIETAAKKLPDDVVKRLKEMRDAETYPMAKTIFDCMFQNLDLAARLDRPLCQDTGTVQLFVKAGTRFPLLDCLEESLVNAAAIASVKTPLRPNAVETFVEKNTGNNIGAGSPWIEYEPVFGYDGLEVTVYLAGGGSSLPGRGAVFMPSAGYEGIRQFVLDTTVEYGINACPPLLVGIGIGSCMASAAKLSKKALLREIGTINTEPLAAREEKIIFDKLQSVGFGPQGLGGTQSVMAVHIENAARHPSTMAAAVSFSCWALRRNTLKIEYGEND